MKGLAATRLLAVISKTKNDTYTSVQAGKRIFYYLKDRGTVYNI